MMLNVINKHTLCKYQLYFGTYEYWPSAVDVTMVLPNKSNYSFRVGVIILPKTIQNTTLYDLLSKVNNNCNKTCIYK